MVALRHELFRLRHRLALLRGGLVLVPGLIVLAFLLLGALTLYADRRLGLEPDLGGLLPATISPDAARTMLVTIAAAMMTAVAMLFSTLLVVQTLASQQFSPRLLGSLLKDPTSQLTLGVTVGNVVLCFVVLLGVRDAPEHVPALGVTLAAALFLASLALLVTFIHHMSLAIQINVIVERIARATEMAVDFAFPVPLGPGEAPLLAPPPALPADLAIIESGASGFIQSVDLEWLERLADHHRVTVHVLAGIGAFATESVALVAVSPAAGLSPALARQVRDAFRLGPVRSIAQDPEFGVRQLVDVALKAISPAVNDPTTAMTCLLQLGRLLVRAAGRHNPFLAAPERGPTPRVHMPGTSFPALLDHALTQLRHYSRSDFAVSLGLLMVLRDVARESRYPPYLERIALHAEQVRSSRRAEAFSARDLDEIDRRYAEVQAALAGGHPAVHWPAGGEVDAGMYAG